MVVVNLDYVISYSSQDRVYKVENLLHTPGSVKPWLCSPLDNSGRIEAEFQLDKASYIDFIDIGNFGSSTVEIQVGRSSFQSRTNYISLLPAVTLLSLADVKKGVVCTTVYMFNKSNLNQAANEEMWDRIKVVCCQPYKKNLQFGLSFLSLHNTREYITHSHTWERPLTTKKNERPFSKYLPKSGSAKKNRFSPGLLDTPMSRGKRLLNASISHESPKVLKTGFKPSAAFKDDVQIFLITCSFEDIGNNKSLEDYTNEFEQQRQQELTSSEKLVFSNIYFEVFQKSKPTTESDFTLETTGHSATATDDLHSTAEYSGSTGHTACFTDDLHSTPECSGFTSHLESIPGCSSFIKKSSLGNSTVSHSSCSLPLDIPQFEIEITGHPKRKSTNLSVGEEANHKSKPKIKPNILSAQSKKGFNRPEDFIQFDGIQPSTSRGFTLVDCPICQKSFDPSEIEGHAASCGELVEHSKNYFKHNKKSKHIYPESGNHELLVIKNVNCPVCGTSYPVDDITVHVNDCMEK